MAKTNAPEKRAAVGNAKTPENPAPTKTNQCETPAPMGAYVKLWSFASPIDVLLRCLGALACAGGGTTEPLMAIVFGNLVNLLNGQQSKSPEEFRSKINQNALYFVYLFIGKFACLYIGAVLFSFTASRMTGKIRLRYLSTVLHQPISYFDTNAPGTIAASLANDTNVVQVGLAEKVGIVFQVCSRMLCAFIISFIKSWKLTLATATMVVYIVLATGFFGGLNATVEAKIGESLNQASGVAEEALSSVLNVTALGASEKMVGRFMVYVKAAMRYFKRMGPLQACIYGNMFLAIYCAYALALFYGVKLINKGEIADGGAIFTVLFCMIIASGSLSYLAPLISDFTKAGAAAQQILRMIGNPKNKSSTESRKPSKTIESLRGDLELRDVTFSYPERAGVTVLEGMSLHIPEKKVTALVGHSGSGKSTIIGLLERWYTVNSGVILVDGENIQELDLTWWRSKIGLVQQEPVLFNDTIYENVLNGLHGVKQSNLTEEQKRELVVEACKQANAHGFIEKLPKGYDTLAGERAGLLSGGQRQRIAIARSIVFKPNILLLDEATSALDSESERAVSLALDNISRGRTTVMIAHKLSTIERADNIVVISKGAIVEQGTHSELVAKDGHYCRLLQAQAALKRTSDNKNTAEMYEEVDTISRKITRQSTQGQVPDEVPSPLESESISRRHSLLYCMYKVYTESPSLIFPSLLGLGAALVCGAVYPLQAVFFSRLVTVFQARGSEMIDKGNFWALMFFILGLSQLVGFLALFYFLGIVGSRVGHVYRLSYFASMLNQDIGFFQSTGNTSGGLTALLAADGVDISMFFGVSAGLIAAFIVDITACCILALTVYWKLALVAIFGCLPAILAAGFLRMRIDLTAQDRCAAAFLENARYSTEAVAAIRTVCSLTMESKVEGTYQQKLQKASASSVKDMLLAMLLYALSDSLTLAACALTFWYGGRLISFQELSTGQFFIIFAAIIFGGESAGIMFGFTSSTGKAHAAMNRILYLNQSQPPINSSTGLDPSSYAASDSTTHAIEFRDVVFRYPSRPSVPVLSGVSFSVLRGSHICIVGPSGCGKSTIVALLERFYDLQGPMPTSEKPSDSGAILVYGRPISQWDISKLRKMMGLVAQDTTLYQGTIRDNILMGIDESGLSKEQLNSLIEGACKQANIHDFITSLPQSYNTSVGARGVALSGGQRQRLALARCLVRNPDILLLDEATSALDSESEKTVREALRKARHERDGLTIVSVTHQVEGMRDADRILVMDKGVIAEEGSWDELMTRKGRLWGMVVQGVLEGTG